MTTPMDGSRMQSHVGILGLITLMVLSLVGTLLLSRDLRAEVSFEPPSGAPAFDDRGLTAEFPPRADERPAASSLQPSFRLVPTDHPAPSHHHEPAAKQAAAAAGLADPRRAREVGGNSSLLMKAASAAMRFPGALSLLLDNDLVVEGFFKNPEVARLCGDPGAMADYLGDAQNPVGVRLYTGALAASFKVPGATEAILGSRLAGEFVTRCSGLRAVAASPALIRRAALGNPGVFVMMADPAMLRALGASPSAGKVLREAQDKMAGR